MPVALHVCVPELPEVHAQLMVAPGMQSGPEVVVHAPAEQVCPLAQTRPQPPQLSASVVVFTQNAPQYALGATQVDVT